MLSRAGGPLLGTNAFFLGGPEINGALALRASLPEEAWGEKV